MRMNGYLLMHGLRLRRPARIGCSKHMGAASHGDRVTWGPRHRGTASLRARGLPRTRQDQMPRRVQPSGGRSEGPAIRQWGYSTVPRSGIPSPAETQPGRRDFSFLVKRLSARAGPFAFSAPMRLRVPSSRALRRSPGAGRSCLAAGHLRPWRRAPSGLRDRRRARRASDAPPRRCAAASSGAARRAGR